MVLQIRESDLPLWEAYWKNNSLAPGSDVAAAKRFVRAVRIETIVDACRAQAPTGTLAIILGKEATQEQKRQKVAAYRVIGARSGYEIGDFRKKRGENIARAPIKENAAATGRKSDEEELREYSKALREQEEALLKGDYRNIARMVQLQAIIDTCEAQAASGRLYVAREREIAKNKERYAAYRVLGALIGYEIGLFKKAGQVAHARIKSNSAAEPYRNRAKRYWVGTREKQHPLGYSIVGAMIDGIKKAAEDPTQNGKYGIFIDPKGPDEQDKDNWAARRVMAFSLGYELGKVNVVLKDHLMNAPITKIRK